MSVPAPARLEEAAATLERRSAAWSEGSPPFWLQQASEDRAVAALLRALADRLHRPIDLRFQPNYVAPAFALADAVLAASTAVTGEVGTHALRGDLEDSRRREAAWAAKCHDLERQLDEVVEAARFEAQERLDEHHARRAAEDALAATAVTGQDERAHDERCAQWPPHTHHGPDGRWIAPSPAVTAAEDGPHDETNCPRRIHSERCVPAAAVPEAQDGREETQAEHFARCGCHDSWDQCPCADSGHPADRSCGCCPLGTGICGPWPEAGHRVMVDAPKEVVERFTNDQAHALGVPGFAASAAVREGERERLAALLRLCDDADAGRVRIGVAPHWLSTDTIRAALAAPSVAAPEGTTDGA